MGIAGTGGPGAIFVELLPSLFEGLAITASAANRVLIELVGFPGDPTVHVVATLLRFCLTHLPGKSAAVPDVPADLRHKHKVVTVPCDQTFCVPVVIQLQSSQGIV